MLTPKTRFCRLKEYIISGKLFYGGNLSFCREKLVKIPVFIRWKDRFVIKIPVLTPKTSFCRLKEYIIDEKLFYGGNLDFVEKNL